MDNGGESGDVNRLGNMRLLNEGSNRRPTRSGIDSGGKLLHGLSPVRNHPQIGVVPVVAQAAIGRELADNVPGIVCRSVVRDDNLEGRVVLAQCALNRLS